MVFVGSEGFVAYSVDNGTTWKYFGVGSRVSSIAVRPNLERLYVLGKRTTEAFVPLRYEGSWGIETHPVSITTLASDLGWSSSLTEAKEFDVVLGVRGGMARTLDGAIVNRVSLSLRQGEIVRMTIDGLFRQDTVATDTTAYDSLSESGTPATFADGSVIVGGTVVGLVQSADVSINVNPNPIYAIGSRYFQSAYLRAFEAEARLAVVAQDTSFIDDLHNLQEYASVVLNFGSAGSVTLSNVQIGELSHGLEANELVIYDITLLAKDVTF